MDLGRPIHRSLRLLNRSSADLVEPSPKCRRGVFQATRNIYPMAYPVFMYQYTQQPPNEPQAWMLIAKMSLCRNLISPFMTAATLAREL